MPKKLCKIFHRRRLGPGLGWGPKKSYR